MVNSLLLLALLLVLLFLMNILQGDEFQLSSVNVEKTTRLFECGSILSKPCTDIYRGWAILIIIIGHVSACWNWAGFGPLGHIGVAMFLLLSGYGLHESYKKSGLKGFWQKKLLRLALPYILFRIIWMMVEGNMSSINHWWSIVNCSNSVFWYIDYIVRCYIAFYVACWLDRWHLKWMILVVFSFFSFFALSGLCASQALSFVCGVAISANAEKVQSTSRWKLLMFMAMSLMFGLGALVVKHTPWVHSDTESVWFILALLIQNLPLAITFIVILYFTCRWFGGQLISLFGALSLELYIIHMRLLPIMVGDSVWQGLALIIVTLLLAYSFNLFCKWIAKLIMN